MDKCILSPVLLGTMEFILDIGRSNVLASQQLVFMWLERRERGSASGQCKHETEMEWRNYSEKQDHVTRKTSPGSAVNYSLIAGRRPPQQIKSV